MDPQKFQEKTQHLLKYSERLERWVVIKNTQARACDHCPREVSNQLITCEPHRLGTDKQHFKHKCHNCRMTVFDGSFQRDPRQLRPINHYVPRSLLLSTGTTPHVALTKNGRRIGRPPKTFDPELAQARPVGRPKKIKEPKTARPRGRPRKTPL